MRTTRATVCQVWFVLVWTRKLAVIVSATQHTSLLTNTFILTFTFGLPSFTPRIQSRENTFDRFYNLNKSLRLWESVTFELLDSPQPTPGRSCMTLVAKHKPKELSLCCCCSSCSFSCTETKPVTKLQTFFKQNLIKCYLFDIISGGGVLFAYPHPLRVCWINESDYSPTWFLRHDRRKTNLLSLYVRLRLAAA